jgi:hypothetical protein
MSSADRAPGSFGAVAPFRLQCPHPNCGGTFDEPPGPREVFVCPTCRRLAARCPREGGGKGRCPALNRPQAQFCRFCRHDLGPAWAQELWQRDVPGVEASRHGAKALMLGAPERVLRVGDHLAIDTWTGWTLGLAEAAGRIWIGAHDGRCLLVEPFSLPGREPRVVSERAWSRAGRVRFRAQTAGTWLLLQSDEGLKLLSLLALDDAPSDDYRPLDLWDARDGEVLVADPIVLHGGGTQDEPPYATAVWATNGPAGLRLRWARLSSASVTIPKVQECALVPAKGLAPTVSENARATLVPVQHGSGRDGLVLATHVSLWWIDRPDRESEAALLVSLLVERPRFVVGQRDAAGVVFVPSRDDDGPAGQLFVEHRDEAKNNRESLCSIQVDPGLPASTYLYRDHPGSPIGYAITPFGRGVLARSGSYLVLCDLAHQQRIMVENQYLSSTQRARVYGRLAICSGEELLDEGQRRWFSLVVDLDTGQPIDLIDSSHPATPLLPIGRHLFAVEALDTDAGAGSADRPELWLTRRALRADGPDADDNAIVEAAHQSASDNRDWLRDGSDNDH